MTSPLHDKRYQIFLEELRALRKAAGLSQKELEAKLGLSQDLISRSESGSRRVDVFELALWTHACGSTLEDFVRRLDARILANRGPGLLGPGDTKTH